MRSIRKVSSIITQKPGKKEYTGLEWRRRGNTMRASSYIPVYAKKNRGKGILAEIRGNWPTYHPKTPPTASRRPIAQQSYSWGGKGKKGTQPHPAKNQSITRGEKICMSRQKHTHYEHYRWPPTKGEERDYGAQPHPFRRPRVGK